MQVLFKMKRIQEQTKSEAFIYVKFDKLINSHECFLIFCCCCIYICYLYIH